MPVSEVKELFEIAVNNDIEKLEFMGSLFGTKKKAATEKDLSKMGVGRI